MLDTLFGRISILSNGNEIPHKYEKLENILTGNLGLPVFEVESRYKITINITMLKMPLSLECHIDTTKIVDNSGVDTGERLALKTWESDNLMFSIGTEDEVDGTVIEYLAHGIKINITDSSSIDEVVFGIAWTYIKDYEKEENYTWFAADPTYYTE